jgi:hypothetical protein
MPAAMVTSAAPNIARAQAMSGSNKHGTSGN